MDGVSKGKIAISPPLYDLHQIFPLAVQSGWTTSSKKQPTDSMIHHVALSDSELGVHRVSSGTTHSVYTLSDGVTTAWEAVYKKGSFKPSGDIKGGFGFYMQGAQGEQMDLLKRAQEVVFSYAVRFQDDFDFVKGGKLPGIYGGEGDKAYACTGGRQDDRCSCFDLRLMWRENGQGELYAYLPPTEFNKSLLLAVPGSHVNQDYGISVGCGSFNFTPAVWTTVSERVKLNDLDQENGEIQIWVNGKSVINVTGLVMRRTRESVVKGMHFQTFFGGSTSEWASSKEQRAWFSNVSGAIIA